MFHNLIVLTLVYNIEQETKDWMFFDTGTWWLYKEVNSGSIDSQFVIQS